MNRVKILVAGTPVKTGRAACGCLLWIARIRGLAVVA